MRAAVTAGYRLFDLAELYGNERAVGRALRHAGTPRGELYVVGKAWRTSFRPAALRQACAASLARLGLDAFDLYLLHAPEAWRHVAPLGDADELGWGELERRAFPLDGAGRPAADQVPLVETWEAMRELVGEGLVARIGVSNFAPSDLSELGAELGVELGAEVGPEAVAVDQIEHSPYHPDAETVDWCRARGIRLMAHSPLSSPGLLAEPALVALAQRHRRSPAQVVLRWNLERGLVPLPSSADPVHIAENLRVLDFTLDAAEMAAIDSLGGRTATSLPAHGRAPAVSGGP